MKREISIRKYGRNSFGRNRNFFNNYLLDLRDLRGSTFAELEPNRAVSAEVYPKQTSARPPRDLRARRLPRRSRLRNWP